MHLPVSRIVPYYNCSITAKAPRLVVQATPLTRQKPQSSEQLEVTQSPESLQRDGQLFHTLSAMVDDKMLGLRLLRV